MALPLRSPFCSEPLITWGEPTLFLGTSVVAANAVPPNAIAKARQAMTPAGVG
jgi:hypothetical protein